jgi:hypothetical protein
VEEKKGWKQERGLASTRQRVLLTRPTTPHLPTHTHTDVDPHIPFFSYRATQIEYLEEISSRRRGREKEKKKSWRSELHVPDDTCILHVRCVRPCQPCPCNWKYTLAQREKTNYYWRWAIPIAHEIHADHLLLDRSPNIGPLISRSELDKFKNCRNKSFRTSKIRGNRTLGEEWQVAPLLQRESTRNAATELTAETI